MKILLIKWKDAQYIEGDGSPPKAELAVMDCVGFPIDETEEAIQLSMESPQGRWRVSIPKTQILSIVELAPKKPRVKKIKAQPPILKEETP